jgi:hypothetical protein
MREVAVLFDIGSARAAVARVELSPQNCLKAAMVTAGSENRLSLLSEVQADLQVIAELYVTESRGGRISGERVLTSGGVSLRVDTPYTPTTMFAHVNVGQVASRTITIQNRDGSTTSRQLNAMTEGAYALTPLSSFINALALRKMSLMLSSEDQTTALQRARMLNFLSRAEAHVETLGSMNIELSLTPEEVGVGLQGVFYMQRPVPPLTLDGIVTEAPFGYLPLTVRTAFGRFVSDARANSQVNSAVILIAQHPEIVDDPFASFLAFVGAVGWADSSVPWAIVNPQTQWTYTPSVLTESFLQQNAQRIFSLQMLYARWFHAGRTMSGRDLVASSSAFVAVLEKLSSTSIDQTEIFESLEEYVVNLFPAEEWTGDLLSAIMAGLAFRRRRVSYTPPLYDHATGGTEADITARLVASFSGVHWCEWPASLVDRVTAVPGDHLVIRLTDTCDGTVTTDEDGICYTHGLATLDGDSAISVRARELVPVVQQHLYELEEVIWSLTGSTAREVVVLENGDVSVLGARSRLTDVLGHFFFPATNVLVVPYE